MPESAPSIVIPASGDARLSEAFGVLAEAIAARAFPGCAFGVFANGRVVAEDALGHFTYEEDSRAVESGTVFDIASITKVVATTAAAMLLWQRGILDLDTPLGEVLPGFVVGRSVGERARHVRLRHLLAHNSGLPGYVELFRTAPTPDALLRACLQLPLEAEPGTRAEYSDPGFILLGKALEVITREPLDTFFNREIRQPLELKSTMFNPPRSNWDRIPPTEIDESFRHRRMQGEVQDENAWVMRGVAGHAGLFSKVEDLLKFSREVLAAVGKSPGNSAALFTRETIETFAQREGPEGSSRALGWDTPSENSSAGKFFSQRSVGHLGYSGCSLWIDLEAGIAIALLTNRTWPDRKNQMIREVRPRFHDAVREYLRA